MSEKTSTKIGTIGTDTSFLIDFFNGEKDAILFMGKNAMLLRISELVIYEFLCGHLPEKSKDAFFNGIRSIPTVGFNREAALIGSEIFRAGKKEGRACGHQDCMITGSYLAHGIRKIVTKNVSHFAQMKDVEVITY